MLSKELISQLQLQTGLNLAQCSVSPISGGDISSAFLVKAQNANALFLKINKAELHQMFIEEAKGLAALEEGCADAVPKILAHGVSANQAYLALEYLEPTQKTDNFWGALGEKLAKVHSKTNDQFGFESQNYIGSLPQYNSKESTWPAFFVEMRLDVQLKMAFDSGLLPRKIIKKFNAFYSNVESIFPQEKPSLVHGDLWLGNVLCSNSKAYLIDPAVYYGHREMDLAFTFMFGGFSQLFYESYEANFPLEPKFGTRVDFYNLYPTLVHLNLFGKSYLAPIENTLAKF
ncbi:MAG: fructosamine kinase family protein [Bacteroidia bacterium]